MRFGVLGTGSVGPTVATKLVQLGHDVALGARQATNEKAVAWAAETGGHAMTMADTAAFGEIVINATLGAGSLEALQAGASHLSGKVVIDISNPIDTTSGFPPTLLIANTDSLGEQIQRAFPAARVVKTLNTVNASIMVNPGAIPGGHNVFLSGNDTEAKQTVRELLQAFGWRDEDILDLGDITTARGPEMYLTLWLALAGAMGTWQHNIRAVKAP